MSAKAALTLISLQATLLSDGTWLGPAAIDGIDGDYLFFLRKSPVQG